MRRLHQRDLRGRALVGMRPKGRSAAGSADAEMTSPVPAEEAWRERFRAPAITRTMVARHRPTRGLVVGTQSGSRQLYSWDVPTGERNQLTFRAEGVPT